MEEALVKAKGVNGQLELFRDKLLIKRKGLAAKGLGGDKEIPIKQIASVEFANARRITNGHIQFVLGGQEAKTGLIWVPDENTVVFSNRQREPFEALKQALEQRIAERQGPAEVLVETPAEANAAATPTSKVAGGAELLNKKLRKLAEQNMSEDETIEFCLVHPNPPWSQAIVALNDRLLVIKPGMAAGATFGARVTSFYYRDINGIEVNTGLINGVVEINTPSYQGTGQKDFWNVKNEDKDPYKVTNCLPISKPHLKDYKPYIDRLRVMIREAKQERVATQPPQSRNDSSLSSELEKLASLRASGVLTDEEFQQAKKRLLG